MQRSQEKLTYNVDVGEMSKK